MMNARRLDYLDPSAVDEQRGLQGQAPLPTFSGPLTLEEWRARDLPAPDRITGEWLTTTSRVLLSAPTGVGKTNFALALAGHCAAGRDFLHWRGNRPARVLFIDGEMSRRLLKRRAEDLARRLGEAPAGLFVLSHEDVDGFAPLNTPAGLAFLLRFIDEIGGVDLIVFDNVMSLLDGDMREEDSWQRVLPLINELTKRAIGQMWIDHTGHETGRLYGTSTKAWRMDTCLHLTEVKREDTDVSFRLEFRKARERTPETRHDFVDVEIALVDDEWTSTGAPEKQKEPSPLGRKFLEALRDAFTPDTAVTFQGWRAVDESAWEAECRTRGILDAAKPHSARTLFSKYRRELITCNLVGCNNKLVWLR
jgi:hypothetical protein